MSLAGTQYLGSSFSPARLLNSSTFSRSAPNLENYEPIASASPERFEDYAEFERELFAKKWVCCPQILPKDHPATFQVAFLKPHLLLLAWSGKWLAEFYLLTCSVLLEQIECQQSQAENQRSL
jgi:hypothetical protein